jgi:bZIP transcription factor.
MRPVIDDETTESVVELTKDEFSVPSQHVRFTHRIDCLLERVQDLEAENKKLERKVDALRKQKRDLQQQQQQRDDRPGFSV